MSAILEVRGSLLDERLHAFFLVRQGEGRMKEASLEADTLGKRGLVGAIDSLLRHEDRRPGERRDHLGRLDRLGQEIAQRQDAADQAGTLRLRRIHHAPGENHLHRLRLADKAGQALGTTGAGDGAELDFWLSKLGVLRGEDEIAHHRELAAAAEGEAGNRGYDRLAACRDPLPALRDEVAKVNVLVIEGLHLDYQDV